MSESVVVGICMLHTDKFTIVPRISSRGYSLLSLVISLKSGGETDIKMTLLRTERTPCL